MRQSQTKLYKLIPALMALPLISCGEDGAAGLLGNDEDCTQLEARIDALGESSAKLTELAASMDADLVTACSAIAGMDAADGMTAETACTAAQAQITAALTAGLTVRLAPPICTVNAEAQLNCEADCYATAEVECTPGEIDVRCDPGELSVSCEGSCDVDAYCEGSAEVAVNCEGSCEGSCTGTCTGTCNGICDGECSVMGANGECAGECTGECQGSCDATCQGSCNGSCQIETTGGIECGANAQCRGGCSGTATAPSCTGTLEPPECMADAQVDCSGSCEGSASLDATCTEPVIEVVGEFAARADFADVLQAQLPVVLKVAEKAQLGLEVSGTLASNAAGAVVDLPSCLVAFAGGVAGRIEAVASATADAAVSVQASASVSVEVSASATASAGGTEELQRPVHRSAEAKRRSGLGKATAHRIARGGVGAHCGGRAALASPRRLPSSHRRRQ